MAYRRSTIGRLGFSGDTAGSVAIVTVLTSGLLFGMAALTIDASRFYLVKRQQQTVTDLAAVAAAANLTNARAAATANLVANNVPVAALTAVELGTYVADPSLPVGNRFTPGGASPNAARVTLNSTPSTFFGVFVGTRSAAVGTRSIAVNANTSAFALGSTLVNTNSGLANAILGGLTGSSLSLSNSDYSSLASANIDLFGLANALALRINASGTYASLAATSVRLSDVLNAGATTLSASGGSATAVAALRSMATAIGTSGPSFAFGSLIGFGPYGNLALGSTTAVAVPLPVLPLVSAASRLSGGSVLNATGLNLNDPLAIQGAKVSIALGQPVAGSSYAAIGPVGTTLHTVETRISLTLQLATPPLLAALGVSGNVSLPLFVDAAPATAILSAVGCSAAGTVDPAATLSVMPGVADAWIGDVPTGALTNFSASVSPGYSALASVQLWPLPSLFTVSGRAHPTVSNLTATPVTFTQADIAAETMKTTATTDYTASLLSSLFQNLQLTATVLGLPASMPSGISSGLSSLFVADLAPVDRALSSTLAMLGLTIGDANTWVMAVRCGQGALVN